MNFRAGWRSSQRTMRLSMVSYTHIYGLIVWSFWVCFSEQVYRKPDVNGESSPVCLNYVNVSQQTSLKYCKNVNSVFKHGQSAGLDSTQGLMFIHCWLGTEVESSLFIDDHFIIDRSNPVWFNTFLFYFFLPFYFIPSNLSLTMTDIGTVFSR